MATFKEIKNNAFSTVVSGELNNTTDPVTFDIATGDGAKFPTVTNGFWATVWDAQYNDPGQDPDMEILLVTARTGDEFVADRGQLGTSAVAHPGEPKMALLFVDQQMKDVQDAINNLDVATTKGDILVFNGTDYVRVGVGSNDQVLTADSAQSSGVKWSTPSGGGGSNNRLWMSWDFNNNPTNATYGNTYLFNSSATATWNNTGLIEIYASDTNAWGQAYSRYPYANSSTTGANVSFYDKNPVFYMIVGLAVGSSTGERTGGVHVHFGGSSSRTVNVESVGISLTRAGIAATMEALLRNRNSSTTSTNVIDHITSKHNSAILQSLVYEMTSGDNIKFYVNGTLRATHTTNLPTDQLSNDVIWMAYATSTSSEAPNTEIQLRQMSFNYEVF